MISIRTSGLKGVQHSAAKATLQQLNGEIAALRIDPSEPDAEAKAVREIEEAVDRNVSLFADNSLIAALAVKSKGVFAEAVRKRIRDARSQG